MKTFSKYLVFYETTILWNGEKKETKEEPIGETIAKSEQHAINNIRFTHGIKYENECHNESQGYERISILKARRVEK